MSAKTLYLAQSRISGRTFTRESARPYALAVMSGDKERTGEHTFRKMADGAVTFSARPDSAEKKRDDLRNRGWLTAYVVPAYAVTIDRTGPDWDGAGDKWYAQLEDAPGLPFAFGRTKPDALANLRNKLETEHADQ